MRYLRLFFFVAAFIVLCGGTSLHAQKKDLWEAVYVNGNVLAPIRSVEGHQDSILTVLLKRRKGEGSRESQRYYEPVLVPLDLLLEFRHTKPSYVAEGALVGFLVVLVPVAIQSGRDEEPFYPAVGFGALLGAIVTGIAGMDDVYPVDALTSEERRRLLDTALIKGSAAEMSVRPIDGAGVREPESFRNGGRGSSFWFAAGTGPAWWTRVPSGENDVASFPRFSFGIESRNTILTGSVTLTSTRAANRVVVDLLIRKARFLGKCGIFGIDGPFVHLIGHRPGTISNG